MLATSRRGTCLSPARQWRRPSRWVATSSHTPASRLTRWKSATRRNARAVLTWIERNPLVASDFSVRDVHRACSFRSAEGALQALLVLEDRGYVRRRPSPARLTGDLA